MDNPSGRTSFWGLLVRAQDSQINSWLGGNPSTRESRDTWEMPKQGESFLAQLDVSLCDIGELQQVLSTIFPGRGGDPDDPQALLYPGNREAYAIKLLFNSKHELFDAIAGPNLTETKLDQARSGIADALRKTEAKIGNWTLFAPVPVTGAFRYNDHFQILPVPSHAPQVNAILAEHPFLLQFRYDGSSNQSVDSRRRQIHARQLELLLSALLYSRIYCPYGIHHAWTINPESIGPGISPQSTYRQLGYIYQGYDAVLAEFTPIDQFPGLCLIAGPEFLGRLGIDSTQVLDLPDYFARLTATYLSLNDDSAQKFRNAGYWFQHAVRTYPSSRSASYVSLAMAIECLMPPPEAGKACECCKRNIGMGPTQQFKEFVSRFVPDTQQFKTQTEQLYKTRSKLAHGNALLISDQDHFLANSLASFDEWRQSDYFYGVVRYALVNWLTERARDSDQSAMPAS